jgi:hypothetical protein
MKAATSSTKQPLEIYLSYYRAADKGTESKAADKPALSEVEGSVRPTHR